MLRENWLSFSLESCQLSIATYVGMGQLKKDKASTQSMVWASLVPAVNARLADLCALRVSPFSTSPPILSWNYRESSVCILFPMSSQHSHSGHHWHSKCFTHWVIFLALDISIFVGILSKAPVLGQPWLQPASENLGLVLIRFLSLVKLYSLFELTSCILRRWIMRIMISEVSCNWEIKWLKC